MSRRIHLCQQHDDIRGKIFVPLRREVADSVACGQSEGGLCAGGSGNCCLEDREDGELGGVHGRWVDFARHEISHDVDVPGESVGGKRNDGKNSCQLHVGVVRCRCEWPNGIVGAVLLLLLLLPMD
jgi:hypothetical protein